MYVHMYNWLWFKFIIGRNTGHIAKGYQRQSSDVVLAACSVHSKRHISR